MLITPTVATFVITGSKLPIKALLPENHAILRLFWPFFRPRSRLKSGRASVAPDPHMTETRPDLAPRSRWFRSRRAFCRASAVEIVIPTSRAAAWATPHVAGADTPTSVGGGAAAAPTLFTLKRLRPGAIAGRNGNHKRQGSLGGLARGSGGNVTSARRRAPARSWDETQILDPLSAILPSADEDPVNRDAEP